MTQARTPPRLLYVTRITDLGPHLRRVAFAGSALAGFPEGSDGAHVKLMFPQMHQTEPVLPTLGPNGQVWPPADLRPVTRTYSVARYDAHAGELMIDFVLHGDDGPASRWAAAAPGVAALGIAGPGGPPRHRSDARWFLLVGDLSALAALVAVLRALPSNARGAMLVEIPESADSVVFGRPPDVAVRWLVRGPERRAGESTLLIDAVRALDWPDMPSVTLAGENAQVIAIRDHLLRERGVPRDHLYAVPYWKDAQCEEVYHAERHRVMDELAAWLEPFAIPPAA